MRYIDSAKYVDLHNNGVLIEVISAKNGKLVETSKLSQETIDAIFNGLVLIPEVENA